MRYYEVHYPAERAPRTVTAIRHLRGLPAGARLIRTLDLVLAVHLRDVDGLPY